MLGPYDDERASVPPSRTNRTPEIIAIDWLTAKKMLTEAQAQLLEVEKELISVIPPKTEGSSTHNLNGFKVELKGVINRKVDWKTFNAVADALVSESPEFAVPSKQITKQELDEPGIKWMQANQPSQYARLSAAITATPGKTGVSIVRTE